MDGRDIGTVVLPGADLKIFLDAELTERARRRHEELVQRGETVSLPEVRAALEARDKQDREREVAPLCPAADAILLDTTAMSISEVVSTIVSMAREKD
jgi:cytidylate kinase